MSDLPKFVHIYEQGPREGFQIESAAIATEEKIRFIDALSETGVQTMQITSFASAGGRSSTPCITSQKVQPRHSAKASYGEEQHAYPGSR